MASIPDLATLLCLNGTHSQSPFGGLHRTILIHKDFTNPGDFVFHSLLQYFSRREPNTPLLLVTASHNWTHYSSSAAKCGFNLRTSLNNGPIEVLDVLDQAFEAEKEGLPEFDLCEYVIQQASRFIEMHSTETADGDALERTIKPIVIMIDDISCLLSFGCHPNQIYRLFTLLDMSLRNRSKSLKKDKLSHFIVQTSVTRVSEKTKLEIDNNLNFLVANLENLCDLSIALRPLETGYSSRIDGTIKIVDNRLPSNLQSRNDNLGGGLNEPLSLFPTSKIDIGVNKAFFFKIGDRRVRLTHSALII